jgi:fructoselysine and glucoselysine-specific PTS system IIA component
MRKFLIATHGTFAKGAHSSLDIIIGPMENVFLIQAYVEENKGIEDDLALVMENISDEDELVVFTDLMGGSVTNQILRYALKPNVHVVSGFNLPLLVEVLLANTEEPVQEVIANAISAAKEQIVYVNQLLTPKEDSDFDD